MFVHCISVVLQMEEAREEYFEQQSSKCVTSDHTLSKLNLPRMDQEVSFKGARRADQYFKYSFMWLGSH